MRKRHTRGHKVGRPSNDPRLHGSCPTPPRPLPQPHLLRVVTHPCSLHVDALSFHPRPSNPSATEILPLRTCALMHVGMRHGHPLVRAWGHMPLGAKKTFPECSLIRLLSSLYPLDQFVN
jgi:hypothetical protein